MKFNSRRSSLLLAALLVLLVGTSCSRTPQIYEEKIYVFGTLVTVTIQGVPEEQAKRGVAAVDQDFQRMHHEWHAWEPGPLVDINKSIAAGKPAKVIPSLVPLIERSKEVTLKSEGMFDPAIGRVLDLWGFHSSEMPVGPPPSRQQIEALARLHPSMADVELRDGVVTSRNRAVEMDFGAIAKGFAVDLALQRLRENGVENAIVNAGGGLGVIGSRGDRPWRVGIRHPQGKGVLASLELRSGESVHTSGNYERFRADQNKRYSHIIDPRSGWPVDGITSVSVIHTDGALADAAATALVVAGVKDWKRIARNLGVNLVMLVEENGTLHMTPEMQRRVEFESEPPPMEITPL